MTEHAHTYASVCHKKMKNSVDGWKDEWMEWQKVYGQTDMAHSLN